MVIPVTRARQDFAAPKLNNNKQANVPSYSLPPSMDHFELQFGAKVPVPLRMLAGAAALTLAGGIGYVEARHVVWPVGKGIVNTAVGGYHFQQDHFAGWDAPVTDNIDNLDPTYDNLKDAAEEANKIDRKLGWTGASKKAGVTNNLNNANIKVLNALYPFISQCVTVSAEDAARYESLQAYFAAEAEALAKNAGDINKKDAGLIKEGKKSESLQQLVNANNRLLSVTSERQSKGWGDTIDSCQAVLVSLQGVVDAQGQELAKLLDNPKIDKQVLSKQIDAQKLVKEQIANAKKDFQAAQKALNADANETALYVILGILGTLIAVGMLFFIWQALAGNIDVKKVRNNAADLAHFFAAIGVTLLWTQHKVWNLGVRGAAAVTQNPDIRQRRSDYRAPWQQERGVVVVEGEPEIDPTMATFFDILERRFAFLERQVGEARNGAGANGDSEEDRVRPTGAAQGQAADRTRPAGADQDLPVGADVDREAADERVVQQPTRDPLRDKPRNQWTWEDYRDDIRRLSNERLDTDDRQRIQQTLMDVQTLNVNNEKDLREQINLLSNRFDWIPTYNMFSSRNLFDLKELWRNVSQENSGYNGYKAILMVIHHYLEQVQRP